MTPPTDEIVEKVAKAIWEANSGPWEFASFDGRAATIYEARSAIKAMEEMGYSHSQASPATSPASVPEALKEIRAVVDAQAEDDGLWFIAHTAAEAYLQQELRKLHAVIEARSGDEGKADASTARSDERTEPKNPFLTIRKLNDAACFTGPGSKA